MRLPNVKRNVGGFRKSLAFFAVAMITLLSVCFASSATAAVSYGIDYDIYRGYSSANGVRPMDNPSVVSNYNLCKSGTFRTVNHNWGGGDIEGCGGDYTLIH